MENKWDDFLIRLRHSFSLKRTKITLYIATVLWVAVVTQMIMNRTFKDEVQITEAFVKSDTQEMQSTLEIVAECKEKNINEDAKKDMIYNLADAIGLIIEDDITVAEEDMRSECYYYKQAKKASTELKVVTVKPEDTTSEIKNYIIVRLAVSDSIQSVDEYKNLLEKALKKIGTKNKQVTLKYEGNREGNLTSEQKREMAALLVDELQGEIALEYDEGDLYTVYGYTGMLNEYVTTLGNKINIQIAITYNELTNKTKITLASPMLNDSW